MHVRGERLSQAQTRCGIGGPHIWSTARRKAFQRWCTARRSYATLISSLKTVLMVLLGVAVVDLIVQLLVNLAALTFELFAIIF